MGLFCANCEKTIHESFGLIIELEKDSDGVHKYPNQKYTSHNATICNSCWSQIQKEHCCKNAKHASFIYSPAKAKEGTKKIRTQNDIKSAHEEEFAETFTHLSKEIVTTLLSNWYETFQKEKINNIERMNGNNNMEFTIMAFHNRNNPYEIIRYHSRIGEGVMVTTFFDGTMQIYFRRDKWSWHAQKDLYEINCAEEIGDNIICMWAKGFKKPITRLDQAQNAMRQMLIPR